MGLVRLTISIICIVLPAVDPVILFYIPQPCFGTRIIQFSLVTISKGIDDTCTTIHQKATRFAVF